MKRDEIIANIYNCFSSVGLELVEDISEGSIDLTAFIPDSIAFITVVIELEDVFNITFPEDVFISELFGNSSLLIDVIQRITANDYNK